jgi:hypothetical protein
MDYQAWLKTSPEPGHVFVETGDADPWDSRKLHWDPTPAQRELAREALEAEIALVGQRHRDGTSGAYAERVEALVSEGLRDAGIDPSTLTPIQGRAVCG